MLRPGAQVRADGEALIAVSGDRGVKLRLGSAAAPLWAALRPLLEAGVDPAALDARGGAAAGAARVLNELTRGGIIVAQPSSPAWTLTAANLRAWVLRECSDPDGTAERLRAARWSVTGSQALREAAADLLGTFGLSVEHTGPTQPSASANESVGHPALQIVATWSLAQEGAPVGPGGGERSTTAGSVTTAVATPDALRYLVLGVDEGDRGSALADGLAVHGGKVSAAPFGGGAVPLTEVVAAATLDHALGRAAGLATSAVLVGPGASVRTLDDGAGLIRPRLETPQSAQAPVRAHVDDEAALDRAHEVLLDPDTGPLGAPRPMKLPQVPVPVVVGHDHCGDPVIGWGGTERVARRRALGEAVARWVAELLEVPASRVAVGVDAVEATALLLAQQSVRDPRSSRLACDRATSADREVRVVADTDAAARAGAAQAQRAWAVLEEAEVQGSGPWVVLGCDPRAIVEAAGALPPARQLRGVQSIDDAGLVVLISTGEDQPPAAAGDSGEEQTRILRVADAERLADELTGSRASGSTCVPVVPLGAGLLIGPFDAPGRSGCAACAVARYRAVLRGPGSDPTLSVGDPGRSSAWDPVVRSIAAGLAAQASAPRADGVGRAVVLIPASPSLAEHRVIALPGCGVCADDQAAADTGGSGSPAAGALQHGDGAPAGDLDPGRDLPQAVPGSLRELPPPDVDTLRALLVDHRFGPVAHAYRDLSTPLAFAVAELVVPGVHERIGGYGRARDHEEAERVALLEALERDAGTAWATQAGHARRATYAELGKAAVDPRTLGLPEPSRVGAANGLAPFDADTAVDWIPAVDLTDGGSILVPAHAAYHGYPHRPGDPPLWVRDSSNGCALGSSLTEAALHGLIELIERDAFLLAWWGRHSSASRPMPTDGLDPLTRHLLDHADSLGYTMRLLDITSDVGLPVVAAVAEARQPDPDRRGAFHCAAGANLDPRRAAAAAVVEVVTSLALAPGKEPEPSGRRAAMLADPFQVRTLEDHVALHEDPDIAPRWAPLLAGTGRSDGRRAKAPDGSGDLRQVLERVVQACTAVGARPLVVDISTPAVRAAGLRAAKVLAPGLVPMSFGHAVARTHGLPRLDALLPPDPADRERALDPHPFP